MTVFGPPLPTPDSVAFPLENKLLLVAVGPDNLKNRKLTQGSAFLVLEGALKRAPGRISETSLGCSSK